MDNGFRFDGKHSLDDFGVIAIKESKRTLAAPGEVINYSVGGMQGTLAFADQQTLREYNEVVRLYATCELGSETAATQLWRRIIAWLSVGRRMLIWDSEADKYVMAEATDFSGDQSGWVEEGLKVTFKVQPERRSVTHTSASCSITDHAAHALTLQVDGMKPAPLVAKIANVGTAGITECVLDVGGRRVQLSAMNIPPGDTLHISMEVPAGATIQHADGTVDDALPYAARFDYLSGVGTVQAKVLLTFGSGSGEAAVEIMARGVWR